MSCVVSLWIGLPEASLMSLSASVAFFRQFLQSVSCSGIPLIILLQIEQVGGVVACSVGDCVSACVVLAVSACCISSVAVCS